MQTIVSLLYIHTYMLAFVRYSHCATTAESHNDVHIELNRAMCLFHTTSDT